MEEGARGRRYRAWARRPALWSPRADRPVRRETSRAPADSIALPPLYVSNSAHDIRFIYSYSYTYTCFYIVRRSPRRQGLLDVHGFTLRPAPRKRLKFVWYKLKWFVTVDQCLSNKFGGGGATSTSCYRVTYFIKKIVWINVLFCILADLIFYSY